MLSVIIFVCYIGITPQNCDRSNAVDVFNAEPQTNSAMCGLIGQTTIAASAFGFSDNNFYVKIQCPRIKPLGKEPIG